MSVVRGAARKLLRWDNLRVGGAMTYLDDCGAPQRGTTDDRHLIILPPASAARRCRYQQSIV